MERLATVLQHLAPPMALHHGATHFPALASCSAAVERRRSVAELFDLKGRVAIVTGGASGIGQQMSEALAEAGANVVMCARNAERCREYAIELSRHAGVRCIGLGVRALYAAPLDLSLALTRSFDDNLLWMADARYRTSAMSHRWRIFSVWLI